MQKCKRTVKNCPPTIFKSNSTPSWLLVKFSVSLTLCSLLTFVYLGYGRGAWWAVYLTKWAFSFWSTVMTIRQDNPGRILVVAQNLSWSSRRKYRAIILFITMTVSWCWLECLQRLKWYHFITLAQFRDRYFTKFSNWITAYRVSINNKLVIPLGTSS